MVLAVGVVATSIVRVHEILPQLTGQLPFAKVLLGAALFSLVLGGQSSQLRRLSFRVPAVRFLGLYFVAMLVSVPLSVYPGSAFGNALGTIPAYAAMFVVLSVALKDEDDVDALFLTLVSSVAMLGLGMLAGLGYSVVDETGVRRGITTMYDPNDIALLAAVAAPFALYFIGSRTRWRRFVGVAGLVGAVLLVVQSGSRGGLIALAVALAPSILRSSSVVSRRARVSMVIVGLAALPLIPSEYFERVRSIFHLGDDYNSSAQSGRKQLAIRGLGHFAAHPFLGVGFRQFSVADGLSARKRGQTQGFAWMDPHNMYIQAAAELGLLGLIAFCGLLASVLRPSAFSEKTALSRTRSLVMQIGTLQSSATAFMIGGFFLSAAYSPILIFLASVGAGLYVISDRMKRENHVIDKARTPA